MNNHGPELSPEARRLINEARGADDPTAEDHARVKARWLASVAAVAGVSSLTEAARAAGGIGWGFKAVGAALVIAAGAVGLNLVLDSGDSLEAKKTAPLPGWSGSSPERFQKTPPSQTQPDEPGRAATPGPATVHPAPHASPGLTTAPVEAVEPRHAEPGQPQAAEAEALDSAADRGSPPHPIAAPAAAAPALAAPSVESQAEASRTVVSQPVAAARPRPPARAIVARANAPRSPEKAEESAVSVPVEAAATAAGPSGQLSEELALLSEVRSSIQEGAAARALDLLNRYESRFGQPILGMEADALRVDALCKTGQRDAARERARAFQSEWPGSPLERRVSAACP